MDINHINKLISEVTWLDSDSMESFLERLANYFMDNRKVITNMDAEAIAYKLIGAAEIISRRTSN